MARGPEDQRVSPLSVRHVPVGVHVLYAMPDRQEFLVVWVIEERDRTRISLQSLQDLLCMSIWAPFTGSSGSRSRVVGAG